MRDYGRLNISQVKTWLPKGEYYFGDPCYAMNDADWTTVCEVLGKIPDIGGPVRVGESVACRGWRLPVTFTARATARR